MDLRGVDGRGGEEKRRRCEEERRRRADHGARRALQAAHDVFHVCYCRQRVGEARALGVGTGGHPHPGHLGRVVRLPVLASRCTAFFTPGRTARR